MSLDISQNSCLYVCVANVDDRLPYLLAELCTNVVTNWGLVKHSRVVQFGNRMSDVCYMFCAFDSWHKCKTPRTFAVPLSITNVVLTKNIADSCVENSSRMSKVFAQLSITVWLWITISS